MNFEFTVMGQLERNGIMKRRASLAGEDESFLDRLEVLRGHLGGDVK